jgi:hypothetical protein
MRDVSADLVNIVRDFMAAHGIMRRVAARFRSGELRFTELHALIGDDDGSVLYRLKERSHNLFRPRDAEAAMFSRGEALFDLAVGSLFHEAMKFRENFYQQEIYGPRVRALRSGPNEEPDPFLREFEKILASVSDRLAEGLQETEILTDQTLEQLQGLLAENSQNGFVARFLVENRARVDAVFDRPLDALFEEITGSAAAGFELAGRSYLDSGFYREAESVLAEVIDRSGGSGELERLTCFARGMAAYLAGDYADCVSRLGEWFDSGGEYEQNMVDIARAAVSKIDHLAEGDERGRITEDAARLVERIGAVAPAA